MNIDFGTAFHKINGNAVKVTLNEFRDNLYLHIREYSMDGDTGHWFPTKSGFAFPDDEISAILSLLADAEEIINTRHKYSYQLEFNFGEINEHKSLEQ